MNSPSALEKSQLRPDRYTWWARIPFVVAGLGGGLLLLVLKSFGVPQVWVTTIAVALIIGYAIVVSGFPVLRLREDQLADNCYYLGFLFTLISLSWALWEFTWNGSESAIVANFGLALGSTIIGILLRVTINQARKDVVESETDARMALAQSVGRLRIEIDDAVLALASFHMQSEQITRDAIEGAAERAAGALDDGIAKVGKASSGVMERIEEAFTQFTESAQQLNTASAGTVRGLKSLLTRIEKIEAPDDIVLRRLEPALSAIAAVTDRLRVRLEADEKLLEEADSKTQRIVGHFEETAKTFERVQQELAQASEQSKTAVHTLSETNEQFGKLLDVSRAATTLQTQLADGARQENEQLSATSRASLDQVASIFQKHNDTMALELERCRRMVAGTGTALAELAETLGERLERPAVPFRASE